MPIEIKVPELGESIVEATVGKWLKHAGDAVKVGEPLVELETDKVNLEVGAERDGILLTIDRQQGQDVKIGDVLGVIDDSMTISASVPAAVAPQPAPQSGSQSAPQPATPVAQRAAAALGVDIQQVPSSGSRVTKTDVEKFAEQANKPAPSRAEPIPTVSQAAPAVAPIPPAPAAHGGTVSYDPISYRKEERLKMSRRRRTIAQRLVEAQHTAAMLTTFNEIDMTAAMEYRTKHQETFQKQHGVKLGFMSFFVKASIAALKQFPRLNAELQGDEMLLKQYYDIGVAIGAEDGLVVPVLRNADALSFADIERKIKAFSAQVEANALALEDLRGGTFTITNGGVFGSMMSTPILNAPQVAILGMHKIEKRPVVVDDQIVIRSMMYVALSYDHRIVDGRESVQFLVRIKELLENIDALLLG